VLVVVNLLGTVPVYAQVAGPSKAGQGSLALLVRTSTLRLEGLILLGFAGTDFVITMTLSAAIVFVPITILVRRWELTEPACGRPLIFLMIEGCSRGRSPKFRCNFRLQRPGQFIYSAHQSNERLCPAVW